LAQGTVCKIVAQEEVKPHKVRYYLERRDPDFAEKMAEVLCVCREVKLLKKAAAAWRRNPSDTVAVISYDEKPGIQAIATTAPDLPPSAGGARGHFAGRHQFDDRQGSRFGQGSPPQPGVYRVSQASRQALPAPHCDPFDPR
jgi:hypothetical protein